MASDPVIKAALDEAKKAMDEWTAGSPVPGMWNKEACAAAIVAFHRRMAFEADRRHQMLRHKEHKDLAAAVEQEARDAGA